MQFINIEEIRTSIQDHILQDIISDDYSIITDIELTAISEINAYISNIYDTEYMFNQKDNKRDKLLIEICKDLMIYYAFQRVSGDSLPLFRIDNYNRRILFLEKVMKGNICPSNWVQKDVKFEDKNVTFFCSNKSFNDYNI